MPADSSGVCRTGGRMKGHPLHIDRECRIVLTRKHGELLPFSVLQRDDVCVGAVIMLESMVRNAPAEVSCVEQRPVRVYLEAISPGGHVDVLPAGSIPAGEPVDRRGTGLDKGAEGIYLTSWTACERGALSPQLKACVGYRSPGMVVELDDLMRK